MNSKHISSPIRRLLGGLLIVFPILLKAQDQEGELTLGSEISSEIKAGEVHRYSVNLEAKTFFFGVVNQRGVDLEVKTLDPSGEEIQVFDSPTGLMGMSPLRFLPRPPERIRCWSNPYMKILIRLRDLIC